MFATLFPQFEGVPFSPPNEANELPLLFFVSQLKVQALNLGLSLRISGSGGVGGRALALSIGGLTRPLRHLATFPAAAWGVATDFH